MGEENPKQKGGLEVKSPGERKNILPAEKRSKKGRRPAKKKKPH